MKTCATCNASHKNSVDRVLRCMLCVARPTGNSNWRPIGHNALAQADAACGVSPGAMGSAAGKTEE
ncbi:MAG: hypothetical protein E6Q97_02265 [Desulfurellales bacterium]|nr:MAG: hypothetical protein E6Q97_02265 [Desulfurellales bacterium]